MLAKRRPAVGRKRIESWIDRYGKSRGGFDVYCRSGNQLFDSDENLMRNQSPKPPRWKSTGRAINWLGGFVWLGLVFSGIGIGISPSRYPQVLGWILLVVAGGTLLLFMDRWVKIMPASLIIGTVSGFTTTFSGHVSNRPSIPISSAEAIGTTLFLAFSSAVSATYMKRKLRMLDRIALATFVFCVFWQAVDHSAKIVALSIGFCCLSLPYVLDRVQRPHSAPTD